jgi:2,4-dienoyl-CoA reductase-like NADH-dependent reductase (Old Yellow Enzyme family)
LPGLAHCSEPEVAQVSLTSPLSLGPLELPGRLFKSATQETRASLDGYVTDEMEEFYEPIAAGGTPLIITGNAYISPEAQGVVRELAADRDDRIPGLRRLADVAHRHGSRIFGQINHCGRQTAHHPDPVSASSIRELSTGTKPRPMREEEIAGTTADFAAAAERLQRAGFDGVQIHLAHGYLLSQFLTPYTNRRTDRYGGSFDARLRFPREVLAAVRQHVGADWPIIVKLNGHDKLAGRDGLRTPDLVRIARVLQEDGVDGVEISVGHYESGMYTVRGTFGELCKGLGQGLFKELPPARRRALALLRPALAAYGNVAWRYREGFNLEFARQFTRELSIPVISVGGWQHRDAIEHALREGSCDAVSAARSFIADPLLYRHLVKNGEPTSACTFCNACVAYAGQAPVDCFEPWSGPSAMRHCARSSAGGLDSTQRQGDEDDRSHPGRGPVGYSRVGRAWTGVGGDQRCGGRRGHRRRAWG